MALGILKTTKLDVCLLGILIVSLAYQVRKNQLYKDFQPLWKAWVATHQEFLQLNQEFQKAGIVNPRQVQIDLILQGKNNTAEFGAAKAAVTENFKMTEQTYTKKAPAFQAATNAMVNLLDYNDKLADSARKGAAQDVSQTNFWVFVGMIFGPITALTFGFLLSNTATQILENQVNKSGL